MNVPVYVAWVIDRLVDEHGAFALLSLGALKGRNGGLGSGGT